MQVESRVVAVSWIPSEAVKGALKAPFELGVAHYDEPPYHDGLRDTGGRVTLASSRSSSASENVIQNRWPSRPAKCSTVRSPTSTGRNLTPRSGTG